MLNRGLKTGLSALVVAYLVLFGCSHGLSKQREVCSMGNQGENKDKAQIFKGRVVVMVKDDFKRGKGETIYYLMTDDGKMHRLELCKWVKAPPHKRQVIVKGILKDDKIYVLEFL
ncbi:MAG: hypothetical protein GXO45_00795 [Aquificae bacterium]|nr:hypothetical protein [Aquificota bacterium]